MPLPKDNLLYGFADKLTDEQREYVDAIAEYQFVGVNAPAGTGKTSLAVMTSRALGRDVLYIFSPIQEGRMGFLPGTLEDKEAPYITPLIDALLEMGEDPMRVLYKEDNIDNIKRGNCWVRAISHVHARGINIKGTEDRPLAVIIDEAANFTRGELKKVLTRIHQDVKVIMIGHDNQCDLEDVSKSGFVPYLEHFENQPYFKRCYLTHNHRGKISQHADKLSW